METISIRLGEEEVEILREHSRVSGSTRSDVIRNLIRRSGRRKTIRPDPFERALPFIGACRTGDPTLSERTGDKFYRMLAEEKRERDARRRRTSRRSRQS
jgi:Ribbon-helix-helix protein, copG family